MADIPLFNWLGNVHLQVDMVLGGEPYRHVFECLSLCVITV